MNYWSICLLFVSLFGTILRTGGVELSFELPDNAKQCFYQEIEKNETAMLEFQVYKLRIVRQDSSFVGVQLLK